jgi:alpha-mannosidase
MPYPLRKVVVVFKTHFDLGFTDLPDRVMQLYTGKMFNAVREVMDATANEPPGLRYSWTLPAWPLRFLLHDPSVPEESRQAARKLVEEGRLNWHAWPFTTHTAFCGLEELVRGLHISRSLSEEFGRWPTGAKQTDVPGHTWILPSMLVRAGVKFLHLGCNSGSHPPHMPRLFWWEGPDASRLLTYYSAGGYGTPLLPPDDWPYDTWLAVQQTVDNIGPQSPEELKRIRRTIEEGAPGVELVFGELGDFADSLLEHPEQLEGLPIVPYDLADTWIHGIGTMPREVARARELRAKLLELEQQAAIYDWPRAGDTASADDFPLARKIAPLIDAAYEQLLLFGEHTWGLDVKSTIKRVYGEEFEAARETEPYKRLESSWAAKGEYVQRAGQLCEQALHIMEERVGEISEEFPPSNSSVVGVAHSMVNRPDHILENPWYRLEVDPSAGAIVSLYDKRLDREWVDKSSGEPFGGYRYDLYSVGDIAEFLRAYGLFFQDWFVGDFGKIGYPEDSLHLTAYARNFTSIIASGNNGHSLIMSDGRLDIVGPDASALPERISIEISLVADYLYIDLAYAVEGKKATPLAESTVVPFPINLAKPAFRLGQAGSVIDPNRDIAEGANRSLWCADWIDTSDDRVGLAVIPADMPLFSLENTGIFRFDPTRVPTKSVIYSHLSNTQWGTNFPQWLDGTFRWRVRLMPHAGDFRHGRVCAHAQYFLSRKLIFPGLPVERWQSPPIMSGEMQLLALRPRHNGTGIIARLYDPAGLSRVATIKLAGPVSAVWRCDLMEHPIEKLDMYSGHDLGEADDATRVELEIRPHSIETLLIEFDKQ